MFDESFYTYIGPILLSLAVIAACVVVLVRFAKKNNAQMIPKLTARASVAKKRVDEAPAGRRKKASPYLVTFAVQKSGGTEYVELPVDAGEYDALREGQQGRLTWQAGKYLGFTRAGLS